MTAAEREVAVEAAVVPGPRSSTEDVLAGLPTIRIPDQRSLPRPVRPASAAPITEDEAPAVLREVGPTYRLVRRATDLVVGGLALLLALPVIGLLTLVVRIDSPGPAIFRQQRVGRDGKLFTFYKFRTMYVDAKQRFPELYRYQLDEDELASFRFKTAEDPRLTRFGRRLRRTSLDELPNLWCVVRGTMTLVGPRPEIPEMVRYYRPSQRVKFAVTPGLTGLAQVSGRNLVPFQQTVRDDLRYVASRSLLFDLRIVLRTVLVVFTQWGAL